MWLVAANLGTQARELFQSSQDGLPDTWQEQWEKDSRGLSEPQLVDAGDQLDGCGVKD